MVKEKTRQKSGKKIKKEKRRYSAWLFTTKEPSPVLMYVCGVSMKQAEARLLRNYRMKHALSKSSQVVVDRLRVSPPEKKSQVTPSFPEFG